MQDPIFEELNRSLHNEYQVDKLSEGKLLYHYTSLQGLKGILTSNAFFATEGDSLNDTSTINYIKNIINSACDQVEGVIDLELMNEIRWFNNKVKWLENSNLFVFSLSEYKDSLFLWSNYRKHDGYNLGINPYDLEKVFFSETLEFRENNVDQGDFVWLEHGKVIYNYNKQINIISDELYNLNALLNKLVRPLQFISDFSKSFFYRMLFYSAFFKDAGSDDECEYRIAATSNKHFSCSKDGQGGFREVDECFSPHLSIPVQSKKVANLRPLKEITIGPKNNLVIAEICLALFKDAFGFNHVRINKSTIPLI